MDQFRVPPTSVLIVPGNHDVDWSVTKSEFKKIPRKGFSRPTVDEHIYDPGKGRYLQICDPVEYRRRFANFAEFFYKVTGTEYPTEYDDQFTVKHFASAKLMFAGMNSAWPLDHFRPGSPSIRPRAVGRVLDKMSTIPDSGGYHKIAVWHHPIHSASDDRIRDEGFVERLAKFGFRIGIHGHVHRQGAEWYRYDSHRGMEIIATGTFGAPTKELPPGSPWEYNLLRIRDNTLTVDSRCRTGIANPWKPYAIWPEGPTSVSPRYALPLRPIPKRPTQMYSRSQLLELLRAEGMDPTEYRLAVEANIFNADGNLLLQKRGPKARDERGKFEGVGGELGNSLDLHDHLRKEICEEIGEKIVVNIDALFEVRPVVFEELGIGPQDWIVVSYLCRLISGKPRVVDSERTSELRLFSLPEAYALSESQLSRSTFRFLELYRTKYGTRPYYEFAG
jgi:ADP-ribose pyrophosphatase YjhB (NUDIX family)